MLCSKLHCQEGFKLKPFFYKIGRSVRAGGSMNEGLSSLVKGRGVART